MTSPAHNHLLYVNEDAQLLDENKKEKVHSVIAKLLHIVKQGGPDMETLVSFMTTRFTISNVDDCKKLKRGLTYVKNTIKDKRIIGAKTLSDLYTWTDTEYAAHNNMRVCRGCNINGAWNNTRKIFKAKYIRENLHIIRVGRNEKIRPIQYTVHDVHECKRLWYR